MDQFKKAYAYAMAVFCLWYLCSCDGLTGPQCTIQRAHRALSMKNKNDIAHIRKQRTARMSAECR